MHAECRTQAEMEAAIKDGHVAVLVEGDYTLSTSAGESPRLVVRGSATLRVVAWESSQPRVEALESSQPRVVARGSSQPRVEARGSSQPRVEAWESSQPRVEAWGYVQLAVFGAVVGTVASTCQVRIEGDARIEGGHQVVVPPITTASEWCDRYGVTVADGVATLYKCVDEGYRSDHQGGISYAPGTLPEATDWDGGEAECGGGLHFSPHPAMTLEFWNKQGSPRFVACPVRLDDVAVHADARMPQKCKARRCCAPVYEVDIDAVPVVARPSEEPHR